MFSLVPRLPSFRQKNNSFSIYNNSVIGDPDDRDITGGSFISPIVVKSSAKGFTCNSDISIMSKKGLSLEEKKKKSKYRCSRSYARVLIFKSTLSQ